MWFAEHTTQLSGEQRLHFYEVLAHNLTVAIRGVWSDAATSDAEKVERMKWVNELLHRVTAKVYSQRLSPGAWTEEDFGEMVEAYIQSDKGIGQEVERAVRFSYRAVTGEEMESRRTKRCT
jgi:hypothetical protein